MDTPQNILDNAVDRAAEITWWNRQMTKLIDVDGVTNATSFVENEIVERKGPYVEFVKAPAFHDQSATAFLSVSSRSPHPSSMTSAASVTRVGIRVSGLRLSFEPNARLRG
jgi:hypothetical protein